MARVFYCGGPSPRWRTIGLSEISRNSIFDKRMDRSILRRLRPYPVAARPWLLECRPPIEPRRDSPELSQDVL